MWWGRGFRGAGTAGRRNGLRKGFVGCRGRGIVVDIVVVVVVEFVRGFEGAVEVVVAASMDPEPVVDERMVWRVCVKDNRLRRRNPSQIVSRSRIFRDCACRYRAPSAFSHRHALSRAAPALSLRVVAPSQKPCQT